MRTDECEKLYNNLQEKNYLIISAIGGMGKTELIKQYLSIYNNHYNKIIWLPYKMNLKDTILEEVNKNHLPLINEDTIFKIILEKINALDNKSIIVFDNVDYYNSDEIEQLLSFHTKVIIISRLNFLNVRDISDINTYFLNSMSDSQCKKIFEFYYQNNIDDTFLNDLLEKTHKHTLAIKLLGKTAYRANLSCEQLIKEINETGFNLSNISDTVTNNTEDDNLRFIEHMLKLYDISEKSIKFSNKQKIILKNLSLLPYKMINLNKLKSYLSLPNFNDIYELNKLGWIEIIEEDSKYISLHPILSEIIKKKLNITINDCKNIISFFKEFDFSSLNQIKKYRINYLEDTILIVEFFFKSHVNTIYRRNLSIISRNIGTCYYNLFFADYPKAIHWFKVSVSLSNKWYISNSIKVTNNYNLGNAYEDYGDYLESIKYLKKALFLSKFTYIELNYKALIYTSLGVTYSRLETDKELRNSMKYYKRAQKIYEKNSEKNKYQLANIKNNKAGVMCKRQEYILAIKYHENAILIMSEVVKTNTDLYPRFALMYINFSKTLLVSSEHLNDKSYLEQAFECLKKSEEIQNKYTEKENPDIAKTYFYLGYCHQKSNELDKARDYYIKAYKINKNLLPPTHPLLQRNIEFLKQIYSYNKNITEFSEWLEKYLNDNENN